MKIYWKKCFVLLAATSVVACSDNPVQSKQDPNATIVLQEYLAQAGGTVSSPGIFTLSAQALTYPVSTRITVSRLHNAPADSRVIPNTVLEFKPDSILPRRALKLTLSYDPSKVPASMGETSLRIYALSEGGWSLADLDTSNAVDVVNHTVRATISKLGTYAVRSTPVDRIVLSGAQADGAMYVGQNSRIDVALFAYDYADVFRSTPSRPIAWKSSAPNVVAVDASGKVTALATGAAVITATVEGLSATSTISVIARPAADWTRASEWSTYRGNAARSGFVDVTADPVVFTERWRKTPAVNVVTYHPIVSGEGKAFLMTADGTRQIIALNALDGSTSWQKQLGPIGASNQPAYDRGSIYFSTYDYPANDGIFYALNAANGSERYNIRLTSYAPAVLGPVIDGPNVIMVGVRSLSSGGEGIHGYDAQTGVERFFIPNGAGGWTPAARNGAFYGVVDGFSAFSSLTGAQISNFADLRAQTFATPMLGGANRLYTQSVSRLSAVDLAQQRVVWDKPTDTTIPPIVGSGVIYSINNKSIIARSESDGAELWTWNPPPQYPSLQSMLLTNNLLFVSTASADARDGQVFAIDLATRKAVWSLAFPGSLSLSSDGTLYIAQFATIAAVSLK